jgi:hypothetical protein
MMLKPTPLVSRTHAPLCRLLSVSLAGTVPFVAPVLSVLLPTFDFCAMMLKPTPLVSRTHAPLCRLLSVSLAGTVPFIAPVLSVLLPTFDFCKAAHPVNATYRLGTSHAHITSDSSNTAGRRKFRSSQIQSSDTRYRRRTSTNALKVCGSLFIHE